MRQITFVVLAAILCLTLQSCFTERNFNYFYDNEFPADSLQVFNNRDAEYRLQPADILSVRVKGLEDREVEPYNLNLGMANNVNAASTYLTGYSVSDSGYIHLPTVGEVYVEGLTVNEARDTIQSKLDVYLRESTVLVHLVSLKYQYWEK
jgi:polysaccharide export outer membrane protein